LKQTAKAADPSTLPLSCSGEKFADDVAVLAEMLSLLVLALEIMDEEARPFGLIIIWPKTKIQTMLAFDSA